MWTLQFWPRPLAHFVLYGQFDLAKMGIQILQADVLELG